MPLVEDVYAFFEREVAPHYPDAWIDESKRDANDGEVGVVGYEINFKPLLLPVRPAARAGRNRYQHPRDRSRNRPDAG